MMRSRLGSDLYGRGQTQREETSSHSLSVDLLHGAATFSRQAAPQNGKNEPSTHGEKASSHGPLQEQIHWGQKLVLLFERQGEQVVNTPELNIKKQTKDKSLLKHCYICINIQNIA